MELDLGMKPEPGHWTLSEMVVSQTYHGNWKQCVYVLPAVQPLLEFAWNFRDREHGRRYRKQDGKQILSVRLIQDVLLVEYRHG